MQVDLIQMEGVVKQGSRATSEKGQPVEAHPWLGPWVVMSKLQSPRVNKARMKGRMEVES